MEYEAEVLGRKRRKLDSQSKNQQNRHMDFMGGAERALDTVVLSNYVKVEEFDTGSSAHADARSREKSPPWPDMLSEVQLDVLVSIKELAMERLMSIGDTRLEEVLPASALQTIGMIMEELVKYYVQKQLLPTVRGSQCMSTLQEDLMKESMDDRPSTST